MIQRQSLLGLLVLLAPLCMANKGCMSPVYFDAWNTNYDPGHFLTIEGEYPSTTCETDPFDLPIYTKFRDPSRLSLHLESPMPPFVDIGDDGVARVTRRGWYFHTIWGDAPASFVGREDPGGTWWGYNFTTGWYPIAPLECASRRIPCPYLSIQPSPRWPTWVTIVSGWQNFNTGASCWTTWPDRVYNCDQVISDAFRCYLPNSSLFGAPE